MMRVLICSVFALIFQSTFSQELIINGDFEEYETCPISFRKAYSRYVTPGWESPTTGTPDIYHRCSKTGAGVPYNWAGVADAKSGDGYAGILLFGHHEFLKTNFITPMEQGREYVLTFYYRLSSYSTRSIDRIGVRLGGEPDSYTKRYVKTTSLDSLTGKWELVTDTLVSLGDESYLIIGNFDSDKETRSKDLFFRKGQEEILTNHAYYYIDKVSLRPVVELMEDSIQLDKIYTFKDILFDFDDSELLPPSLPEIDQLITYLINNPQISIEIYGHTDESGDEDYNLELSEKRAKSVADYLVANGVDAKRLDYFGYGESRPVGNDDLLNRRVEFRLIDIQE